MKACGDFFAARAAAFTRRVKASGTSKVVGGIAGHSG